MTYITDTDNNNSNAHLIGNFEARVADSMTRLCEVPKGATVLVAVSGGADSTALLIALQATGYDCVAAHCNFHLRGEESNRDMHYVEQLTASLGIPLHIKHFDVASQMQATGESMEMACRSLRYAWFETLVTDLGAAALAVAHHREDQAETFFLNLLRTTGLGGLTGMMSRNGYIVRPLLNVSRTDIETYLKARAVNWVDDSTNADSAFRRNRLRNEVLPHIEQHFPGAGDAVLATMGKLADTKRLHDYAVGMIAKQYVNSDDSIDVAQIQRTVPAGIACTLLFELIRPRGFNATHATNILRTEGHGIFEGSACTAELSRGTLRFSTNTPEISDETHIVDLRHSITKPIHIEITNLPASAFKPERNPNVAYFDARVLDDSAETPQFVLRHWHQGDRMRPYGLQGAKLVSDIFADAHLTARDKRHTWLLTRNDRVLWVPGIRASAHFAVTADTTHFLRLEYKPDTME